MRIGTIDTDTLRGVTDKIIGLGKETVGILANNESLRNQGEAQQDRATEQLKTLRAQVEAEVHEAKAEAAEERQKVSQNA